MPVIPPQHHNNLWLLPLTDFLPRSLLSHVTDLVIYEDIRCEEQLKGEPGSWFGSLITCVFSVTVR